MRFRAVAIAAVHLVIACGDDQGGHKEPQQSPRVNNYGSDAAPDSARRDDMTIRIVESAAEAGLDATMDAPLEDAALDGSPAVPQPVSLYCGDGIRDPISEECDDWPRAADDDGCTDACVVRDELASASTDPSTQFDGGMPRASRYIGQGRHPVAAGHAGFAVIFTETDESGAANVSASLFDEGGLRTSDRLPVVANGGASFDANPVTAALADGTFAAAWNDFGGDGDDLGIALGKFSSSGLSTSSFANEQTSFSQLDPDIVWTGTELVIAWVDMSDVSTAPDVMVRTFDSALDATSEERPLAATSDHEGNVALAARDGFWAAAWRAGQPLDASETIVVQRGAETWTTEPFPAAPQPDTPGLALLQNGAILVFTEGTLDGPLLYSTPRLRAAVLTSASQGVVTSCPVLPRIAPYDTDTSLGQYDPNVVVVGERIYVAWRSERVTGDPLGDELWLKELRLADAADGSSCGLDMSLPELPLQREPQHRYGDQRRPALAASDLIPQGAIVSAWEDQVPPVSAQAVAPDVFVELIPVPIVRFAFAYPEVTAP